MAIDEISNEIKRRRTFAIISHPDDYLESTSDNGRRNNRQIPTFIDIFEQPVDTVDMVGVRAHGLCSATIRP